MARMIPPTLQPGGPNDRIPSGERRLFAALQDDPATATWTVLHSVHIADHPRGVGESDFVVIVPDMGVLVIEVKSARAIQFEDGLWSGLQPSQHRTRLSPFVQADQMQHAISGTLRKAGIDLASIPLTHCVWFTSWSAKAHLPSGPGWEDWQVLDNTDLDAGPDRPAPLAPLERATIRQIADHRRLTTQAVIDALRALGAPVDLTAHDTVSGRTVGLLEDKDLLPLPVGNTPVPSTILRTLEQGAHWLQDKDGIHKDFRGGIGPDPATAERIAQTLVTDSDDPLDAPASVDDLSTWLLCCKVEYENDHEFTFLAHRVLRAGLDIRFVSESPVDNGYLEVYAVSGRTGRLPDTLDLWGVDQILNHFTIDDADPTRRTGTLRVMTDDEDLTIKVSQSETDARAGHYQIGIRNDPYYAVDRLNQDIENAGVAVELLDREKHRESTASAHPETCRALADMVFGHGSRWDGARPFVPEDATARIVNG